ncbi:putative reverse transcriptase (RNA-dependent DNA polymerase) [Trypanosoma cruzi]|uniref:Putative reverse transcriptase (RNA-dependent DNA polymerase) n=1 Tax=Trypanosoma cruzi TaxID=5693 RepID=A0A2V2V3D2_TRYCR|nr:putative reverse transcriptase (RNA-dependent DNA polymerase) [Trypanosoma cruzi]
MALRRLLWLWTPRPHQHACRSMRTTTMQLAHPIHEVEHNRTITSKRTFPRRAVLEASSTADPIGLRWCW